MSREIERLNESLLQTEKTHEATRAVIKNHDENENY
jgi:hypothetical protein